MLLFLPAQSVASFFNVSGILSLTCFSLSVTTKYPAQFRIRSTSLTFSSPVCCSREVTPRPSKYAEMSSLHANKGTICDPVPSKLEAESGELNKQVKATFMLQTAKSAELQIIRLGLKKLLFHELYFYQISEPLNVSESLTKCSRKVTPGICRKLIQA